MRMIHAAQHESVVISVISATATWPPPLSRVMSNWATKRASRTAVQDLGPMQDPAGRAQVFECTSLGKARVAAPECHVSLGITHNPSPTSQG